ncbi:hypothetical protein [Bacillus sp. 2205SS5-2]|uniref:hypothetical protein n=1 Tax=Bacillus sp. 2205SS5-2 TaxID=3109031 RepID=UPI00300638EE
MEIIKKSKITKIVITFLSFALVLSTLSPSFANASTSKSNQNDYHEDSMSLINSNVNKDRLEELAADYVVVQNTRFKIVNEKALVKNANQDDVKQLKEQVKK